MFDFLVFLEILMFLLIEFALSLFVYKHLFDRKKQVYRLTLYLLYESHQANHYQLFHPRLVPPWKLLSVASAFRLSVVSLGFLCASSTRFELASSLGMTIAPMTKHKLIQGIHVSTIPVI